MRARGLSWKKSVWPLRRGARVVVNLLLSLVLGLYIWALFGYPLPTLALEFHRMERQMLLPKGEIVFWEQTQSIFDVQAVAVQEEGITVASYNKGASLMRRWHASYYPPQAGITVVPMNSLFVRYNHGDSQVYRGVLVLGLPQGVQEAQLTLHADWGTGGQSHASARSEVFENGTVLFLFENDKLEPPLETVSEEEAAWARRFFGGRTPARWDMALTLQGEDIPLQYTGISLSSSKRGMN